MADMDENAADEFGELYAPNLEQLSATFPQIARRSAFLTIYATFEYSLLVLCWQVQKIRRETFGPQDLRSEFCGSKAFLDRMVGIKMNSYPEWQKIDGLRKLRNLMVHQAGHVPKGETSHQDLIRHTAGVSLDDEGMLCVTDAFCLDAIGTIRGYVKAMMTDLRKALQ